MTDDRTGTLPIKTERDVATARMMARNAAAAAGFGLTDVTRIVTAVSELARNIIRFAGAGVVRWRPLDAGGRNGIEVIAEDHGPGIPDIARAMEEGYTTGGGLGMGLPGSKRLMDELEIQSEVGRGTTVTVRKWRR